MKLSNLQILRGISALLVCFFHFREMLNVTETKIGDRLFSNGGIGVPVFFVISGFIMVYTTKKINSLTPKSNAGDFLIRRMIRIVPLYYLLTIGWMILGRDFAHYFSPEVFPRTYHSFLFLPYQGSFPVLFQGWSLNYEMFFYAIFAVSFFMKEKRYVFLLAVLSLLLILGNFVHFENAFAQMATAFINIHFILGILIGLVINKINMNRITAWLMFIGSNILFWLMFFDIIQFPELADALIVSFLVFGYLCLDQFTKMESNKFLVFLGDISYSVYLVHPFIGVVFRRFETENLLYNIILFAAEIMTVTILSKLLFSLIEVKFTNYLKKKLIAPS